MATKKKSAGLNLNDVSADDLRMMLEAGFARPEMGGLNDIFQQSFGSYMNPTSEEDLLRSQMVNNIMGVEAQKLAEGDTTAISRINDLISGGYEGYASKYGTTSTPDVANIPDEYKADYITNQYAQALATAQKTGDYSKVNALKSQYGNDYDFSADLESGNVEVKKKGGEFMGEQKKRFKDTFGVETDYGFAPWEAAPAGFRNLGKITEYAKKEGLKKTAGDYISALLG